MPTAMTIKELNMELIKTSLKKEDFSTKISLASATGLSVATCGNILNELVVSGEALELDLGDSTGGRPSKRFKYNKDIYTTLSLYVRKEGRTNTISYAVSNLLGEAIYEQTLPYEHISIHEIDALIREILLQHPNIRVLAIGVPGIVLKGAITYCDFEDLCDFEMSKHLEKTFSMKVIVENDVNVSALGFFQKGNHTNEDSLVYVYYPINGGPGAGIIVNGAIIRGASNYAGEVANIPFGLYSDELAALQNDFNGFNLHVAKTIIAINCIINPKVVVLSGLCFSKVAIRNIQSLIK
ncbi:MAG: ROK family protein, partial [Vallitaleaceae bacterium]|nr:ROK family protein [Vallitaleaceae bacterium]